MGIEISTAKLFLDQVGTDSDRLEYMMVTFASLHVSAVLKAAAEKATLIKSPKYDARDPDCYEVDTDSILGAYPFENIK